MKRAQPKPKGMSASGALGQQAKLLAELTVLQVATGNRVLELTELVGTLVQRIDEREAAKG